MSIVEERGGRVWGRGKGWMSMEDGEGVDEYRGRQRKRCMSMEEGRSNLIRKPKRR